MTSHKGNTVTDLLRDNLKRVYFNGSTDVVARKNGVIPNDTKLGEVQIEAHMLDMRQALGNRMLKLANSLQTYKFTAESEDKMVDLAELRQAIKKEYNL